LAFFFRRAGLVVLKMGSISIVKSSAGH